MPAKSNLEWMYWGKTDPLWAVAAWKGKRKNSSDPWNNEDFYELGRKDWNDFLFQWEKYGVDKSNVLELGCGAGRITKHLSDSFNQVIAVDISKDMISYAKKNIGNSNVEYIVTSGDVVPIKENTILSVFSTHVFQHLDSLKEVNMYFKAISRILVPGGTMMIHIPIHNWPHGAGKWTRRGFRLDKFIENYVVKKKRKNIARGEKVDLMRMHSYGLKEVYNHLPKFGYENIIITIFITKSNNDPHPFVLATKK